MKIRLDKKELRKSLLNLIAVAVIIFVYYYITKGMFLLADSVFMSGLLFFCIALWRIVRILGFFESTIYSFKKMFKKTDVEFYEYTQDHPYTEHFVELLILSIAFIVMSMIFSRIL